MSIIKIEGEFNAEGTGILEFLNSLFTDEWVFYSEIWIRCYPHYLLTQEATS